MTTLDLKELDRLEREATEANWYKASVPCGTLEIISPPLPVPLALVAPRTLAEKDVRLILNARNQLRPLLNLVDDLGKKLEDAATALHGERAHEGRFWDCQRFGCASANVTIKSYRRAKGK